MAIVWLVSLILPNVHYERFGFLVTAESDVIGVKNWFMTREPLPPRID